MKKFSKHKLLFVIDHFGSGGAQRQMVSLAIGLAAKGHDVEFFNYYPEYDFFYNEVVQARIKTYNCYKTGKGFSFKVLFSLRKILKVNRYDLAIAFLDTPSIYLLLAGSSGRTKKIVSDRSSYLRFNKYKITIKRQLFHMADAIVTNSYTQSEWLVRGARLPAKKVWTIYNGYKADVFQFRPLVPNNSREIRLIAIGRINPVKNVENLIEALDILYKKLGWCPAMTWVGRSDAPEYEKKINALLESKPQVKKAWTWAGERNDVPLLLAQNNALILTSLYEGLPNVVCEAMFVGKPILASNVCDNPVLVEEYERGFLFDPNEPESIADAIAKLTELMAIDWQRLSRNAHEFARSNLDLHEKIVEYEALFAKLMKKQSK